MGNTKLIYIEGEFAPGRAPTEAQLIDWSHGSYCAAKVVAGGYLGQGKDVAEYLIASLHTSSMVGVNVVDALAQHRPLWATVVVANLEWSDVKIHHIDYRRRPDDNPDREVAVYEPRAEPPPPPSGPPPPDFQQCAADPYCGGTLVCEQSPIGWRFWCRAHSPHTGCQCKPENVVNAVAFRRGTTP